LTNPNKPVWLLDIDGVLNAVSKEPQTNIWPHEAWVQTEALGYSRTWPILAAQPVVDFINEVHASGLVEIRWHTTWQEAAQNLATALGLPTFEVQDAPEFGNRFGDNWWKWPAGWRVVSEEGRPLVWTDDDLSYGLEPGQGTRLREVGKVLLISPASREGLVKKHLTKIQEFIDLFREEVE
jgi:hypothetical protein